MTTYTEMSNELSLSCARLLAGLANSLLTGNVYMAECAPSNLVPSLKQIEVEILIYLSV